MNLEEHLSSRVSLSSESPSTTPPSPYPMIPRTTGTHIGIAIISAIVGLFIFPEIFDSAAIILGAYAWKRQEGNMGLYVVILGIACMLIGLYLTAFIIGDLFP
jgi:hypothetical protein